LVTTRAQAVAGVISGVQLDFCLSRQSAAPRLLPGGVMSAKTEQHTVTLRSGDVVPALGLGTWRMGESPRRRTKEIAAVRLAIDLGMSVIDTAEMYGDGATERLVGEAIRGRRKEVFLVSKVLPNHARRDLTFAACAASLDRLGTDYLDLYLLHWRGRTPLREMVDAFTQLVENGKIRYWGVSNFDLADMKELVAIPGGSAVACNQVLYNLSRRGIELDLLPWCRRHRIPVMAYSPIEQARLLTHEVVKRVAATHNATAAQLCLRWVLRQEGVLAIPKAGTPEHVREDYDALQLQLTKEDLRELDEAFPPPGEPKPLEII
jgi:diketogulonate reductase-like aldo/keto reductase